MWLLLLTILFIPNANRPTGASTAWITSEIEHDFHISRCEINWDQKSGDIQIAAHIFIDDLETALMWRGVTGLRIGTETEKSDADRFITSYFSQKLVFREEVKTLPFVLVGKEVSNDKMAIWCYLEVPAQKHLKSLTVENSLLTEVFPDQKNIVELTMNGKRKGFVILDGKKKSETFTF
jgi:hypothetical protein